MKYEIKCNKVNTDIIYGSNNSRLVGLASIIIDNKITINNIKLIKKDSEINDLYFINFPSRKTNKTESGYTSIAHPVDKDLSQMIDQAIFNSYQSNGEVKTVITDTKFKMSVTVTPYESENSNIKGIANVELCKNGEFHIQDIYVREGKNGLFVALPSYQKKDETYANILHPASQEFYHELNTSVIEAYHKAKANEDKSKNANISVNSAVFKHNSRGGR